MAFVLEEMLEKGELVLDHRPLRRKSFSDASTDSSTTATTTMTVDDVSLDGSILDVLQQPEYVHLTRNIRSVVLSDRHECFNEQFLYDFFPSTSRLEKIRLYAYERTVSALCIATCLQHTLGSLKTLHITSGVQVTCQKDVNLLARALTHHPMLEEVALLDFDTNTTTTITPNVIDINRSRSRSRHDRFRRLRGGVNEDSDNDDEDDDGDEVAAEESIRRSMTGSHVDATWSRTTTAERTWAADPETTAIPVEPLSLDPLFQAFGTMPRLQSLDITLSSQLESRMVRLQDRTVAQLFAPVCVPMTTTTTTATIKTVPCPLVDVSLWHCRLDNGHLQALCDALSSGHGTVRGSEATSMDRASTALKFLSLRSNPRITNWKPMADMLQHNTMLQSVYCNYYNNSNYSNRVCVAKRTDDQDPQPCYEQRIANLLSWNQLGRGELLQDDLTTDAPKDWIELIASQCRQQDHGTCGTTPTTTSSSSTGKGSTECIDPDALFCLLRTDPCRILGLS